MIKDKKYLEELIEEEGFYDQLDEVFVLCENINLPTFDYNENDQCFYSIDRPLFNDKRYRLKMSVEELPDGGPNDIMFNISLGDFKNFEEMTNWEEYMNIGTILYKDGQWS